MEKLVQKSGTLVGNQSLDFVRFLVDKIDWNDRLVGILGARGTGKTTMLLQYIKRNFNTGRDVLYLTLDDIYFSENRLTDVAETFYQHGGKFLFLDEVHKYPDWAREIKNLYDLYPDIRIVFTGSSVTDILRQDVDLSRRAVQYELPGLSLREYLKFTGVFDATSIRLGDLLENHVEIATEFTGQIRPLLHFSNYMQQGYYPFFAENPNTYPIRIEQVVKLIVETDMRFMPGFDPANTRKLLQLLYVLATNVPFKPNISALSSKIGIHRNTLVQYIHYLEKARLINTLSARGKSVSILQKPDKVYLENANLHQAIAPDQANIGSMRESFFLNQLRNAGHQVSIPAKGDFLIDDHLTFEIGGKKKTFKQIEGLTDSYIAADGIETGVWNKVPLWLFGFLY